MIKKMVEQKVDFKIGDVTFGSYFKVTIPDFGFDLPECNSHTPVSVPIWQPLYNIFNWINRGMHPQFPDEKDAEKIFYFIKAYNEAASKINQDAGKEMNKTDYMSEEYFLKKMKYLAHKVPEKTVTRVVDGEEVNVNVKETPKPVENPFTKEIVPKRFKRNFANHYVTEHTQNLFSKVKPKKQKIDNRPIAHHKMFEIFEDDEKARRLAESQVNQLQQMTRFQLGGVNPQLQQEGYYDDIELGN